MTIPAPGVPAFVNDVSTISQTFLNWLRTNVQKAVDGTDGGSYTPTSLLTIAGSGIAGIVGGTLTLGSDGRAPLRLDDATLGDSNTTFRAGSISDVYRFAGNVTANRTWTISNTDAVAGERVRVIANNAAAFSISINNGSGSIATFPSSGATTGTTSFMWVDLIRGATDWEYECGHPDVSP